MPEVVYNYQMRFCIWKLSTTISLWLLVTQSDSIVVSSFAVFPLSPRGSVLPKVLH